MGLNSIEKLNEHLPMLIEQYNAMFCIPIESLANIKRPFDKDENIVFHIEQSEL